tara:strand:- start:59 stop:298 length:240 start_codon:yes stop_codon:yes gene_type:complete
MSEADFDRAGDEINALIDEMMDEDLNAGAVLGGALTAIVFRLIVSSPDSTTAIGMITSCMANGARIAAEYEETENETYH